MITVAMVCELIEKKLGSKAASVTLDADTVFDAVGLSSLQIADIVYTIEDEAGVELDPGQAANVKTVGDLVNLVQSMKSVGNEA
ncbi:acyl carrier protein [Streptomyces sp. AJS327]|uniref:acyl carrier protein n=1 Tax=Streptomyces sp. AJS327 TaxID=2545265 RepID=UPI0015DE91A0|nr:phosphopantetheine-binding protein [Streptomyces sp. AJS327]MBA0053333.1 acyl carrier protein [Streptomyces sp. AJS327]